MRGDLRILGLVMAGGEGRRLMPLTEERSKPSVPFGGSYRIVDFVLSNLLNSGIYSTFVLVQYRSQSLIHHLREGWRLSSAFQRALRRGVAFGLRRRCPQIRRQSRQHHEHASKTS